MFLEFKEKKQPVLNPKYKSGIILIIRIILLLLVVELINSFTGRYFLSFGVNPDKLTGLFPGMLYAPFLHANFSHFLSNSIGIAIFGGLVTSYGLKHFWSVTLWAFIITGLFMWFLGEPGSVHIGASGIVYAYAGFIAAHAFAFKDSKSAAILLLLSFMFVGILIGMAPFQEGISWQGHVGGFVSGILYIIWYKKGLKGYNKLAERKHLKLIKKEDD